MIIINTTTNNMNNNNTQSNRETKWQIKQKEHKKEIKQ